MRSVNLPVRLADGRPSIEVRGGKDRPTSQDSMASLSTSFPQGIAGVACDHDSRKVPRTVAWSRSIAESTWLGV